MDCVWLLNTWMLKFEKGLYTSKQEVNSRSFCNPVHTGDIYHIFAYTVWYDWQLKLLALRQDRKLDDGEAKRGRNVRNQPLTKSPLCSCAWVKLAILTSPRASRAFDKDGKLLFPAWVWKNHFGYVSNLPLRNTDFVKIVGLDLPW